MPLTVLLNHLEATVGGVPRQAKIKLLGAQQATPSMSPVVAGRSRDQGAAQAGGGHDRKETGMLNELPGDQLADYVPDSGGAGRSRPFLDKHARRRSRPLRAASLRPGRLRVDPG